MDKTRILPPLVHGKTTGVLDFCVEEIRIFRNILLFTENCDLVAQVQWWGEILPAYIRPRQLHLPKILKKCEFLKSYCYGATYEIKTTLDLFKSYLETCEILELEVYEAIETCLIGSAFLKDLINLVFQNNEPVEIPLINYLGEKVGKIKIHIHFSANSASINNEKQNIENTEDQVFSKIDENKKNYKRIQVKKKNLLFLNEKTIYANQESKKFNSLGKSFETCEVAPRNYQTLKKKSFFNKCNDLECNIAHGTGSNLSQKCEMVLEESVGGGSQSKAYNKSLSSKCFPEVKLSNDSSKVLHFEIGLKKSQLNATKTFLKTEKSLQKGTKKPFKNIGQLSSCKGNKHDKDNLNIDNKYPVKVCQSIKQPKMANQNFGELQNFSNDIFPLLRFEVTANDKISSEEFTTGKKTVDYLLGVELSKEDEESALNDLKKMSPCQDFVSSISQLCTISDNSLEKLIGDEYSQVKISPPTRDYVKVNNLNFNLSNTIERNYLKKFFNRPNDVQNDFEIAELLNKHKNPFALEERKSNDKTDSFKDLVQGTEVEKYEEKLLNSKAIQKKNDNSVKIERDHFLDNVDAGTMANFCAQCKYNKKLEELDVIIESIKHFEKNMLLQEKVAYQELNSVAMKNINNFFNERF